MTSSCAGCSGTGGCPLLLLATDEATAEVLRSLALRHALQVRLLAPGLLELRGEPVEELLLSARAALSGEEAAGVRCARSRCDAAPEALLAQAMTAAPLDVLLPSPHSDALTGLPDRWALLQQLESALDTSSTGGRMLAVLLLALQVDGDERVFAEAAARCRAALRGSDLLARHEATELCAVLVDLDPADAERIALRVGTDLLAAVERPVVLDGQARVVRAHAGLVLFPAHGWTTTDLLDAADEALHDALARDVPQVLAPY